MDFKDLEKSLSFKIQKMEQQISPDKEGFVEKVKELNLLKEQLYLLRDYLSLEKKINETLSIKDPELEELAEEELKSLKTKAEISKNKLLEKLSENPIDLKNAILEIHAGAGGDEAEIFAQDLLRMYLRYAEKKGYKTEILGITKTPLQGIKEAKILIRGDKAYGNFKYEAGVHRIQRIPLTEKRGRIHTSTAGVIVLPEASKEDIEINENDLKIDVFRASGPGGQSVNTTDSAVRITHLPSGIVVTCQDEKSQHKNKEKALKILRSKLLAKKLEEETKKEEMQRKSMVKNLERSDKIRTYNFPQSRITDHRINLTVYNLEEVLNGNLDDIIQKLKDEELKQKIADKGF